MKGSGKSGNSRVSTGRNERAVAAASPFLLFGGVRLVIGDEEEDGRRETEWIPRARRRLLFPSSGSDPENKTRSFLSFASFVFQRTARTRQKWSTTNGCVYFISLARPPPFFSSDLSRFIIDTQSSLQFSSGNSVSFYLVARLEFCYRVTYH